MNILQMKQSTNRLHTKPSLPVPQNRVTIGKLTANIDDNTLLVTGTVQGHERNPYTVNMLFFDTESNPVMVRDAVEIPLIRGEERSTVLIKRVVESRSPVQCNCLCADYTFSFAHANFAVKAHYGELPQYTKKPGHHKPRNPQHIPGLCRHLIAFTIALKRQNIMRS